jgi:hypothetical protein
LSFKFGAKAVSIHPQHHDYFIRYLAFGSVIFRSLIPKNQIPNFLSKKIKSEHPDIDEVKHLFSKDFISPFTLFLMSLQLQELKPDPAT